MRSDFLPILHKFTLPHEGGTNYHIYDRGGLTKFGISQKQYPGLDIEKLTLTDAENIYRADYWEKIQGQELAWPIAAVMFDSSVNCGLQSTCVWLQKSINMCLPNAVVVDGIIGHQTLSYLQSFPPFDIASKIVGFRLQRYVKLIQRDPEQRIFVLGWVKRASDLLLFI